MCSISTDDVKGVSYINIPARDEFPERDMCAGSYSCQHLQYSTYTASHG
jgi:hypothetical protein